MPTYAGVWLDEEGFTLANVVLGWWLMRVSHVVARVG